MSTHLWQRHAVATNAYQSAKIDETEQGEICDGLGSKVKRGGSSVPQATREICKQRIRDNRNEITSEPEITPRLTLDTQETINHSKTCTG